MASTYTVKKGDTLPDIAKTLGGGLTTTKLMALNRLEDPNYITVGQKLVTSGTAVSNKKNISSRAIIKNFGLQSNTDRTIYACWSWDQTHTKEYRVIWYYDTGDGVWFVGNDSTVNVRQSTYNAPSNAIKIKFKVKPISTTHKVNKKDVNYWTANWSNEKTYRFGNPPLAPSTPEVKIEKYKLTASLTNIDVNANRIQFQIVKNDSKIFRTGTVTIKTTTAKYSCNVSAGGNYKVRCRSVKGNEYSDWSEYSGNVGTAPLASKGFIAIKAKSETEVYLDWYNVSTATSYEIQYTTEKRYFDSSPDNVTTQTVESNVGHAEITGLESGHQYFFRVRAVNDNGESGWTEIRSIKVGAKPSPPTTWSSTTTVTSGEPLILYWVHNSEDGSSQTYANLKLNIGGTISDRKIQNSTSEEEKDKTSSYTIDTSLYDLGTIIKWKVQTRGITATYSDWSVERTVTIYAPPTLSLDILDYSGDSLYENKLRSFPFTISGEAGPITQNPIGYHVSIISNDFYMTTDNVGNEKAVYPDEEVYSTYINSSSDLALKVTAGDVNLQNNVSYTVKCIVSMNSGLTAESSYDFIVEFDDTVYEPSAEIGVNQNDISTVIRPYCETYDTTHYIVNYSSETDTYTKTDTKIENFYNSVFNTAPVEDALIMVYKKLHYIVNYSFESGAATYTKTETEIANFDQDVDNVELMDGILTTTGEQVYSGYSSSYGKLIYFCEIEDPETLADSYQVYSGTTKTGESIYYCEIEDIKVLVSGVLLSVYRREFDGSFTEIARDLENTDHTFVLDPHPSLDYARYRIVAMSETTGAMCFCDLPGEPINEKSVIIQWDEAWSAFDVGENGDELEQPPWSGSLLKLPYNIDVSDNSSSDVELVEYIGRKHPVSYYGTQRGETATWNVVIEKDDIDTLYALRRLKAYMGDVYVREPSGSGYWANISVSFSQKHCDLTIPVTLDIKRVEGGN